MSFSITRRFREWRLRDWQNGGRFSQTDNSATFFFLKKAKNVFLPLTGLANEPFLPLTGATT